MERHGMRLASHSQHSGIPSRQKSLMQLIMVYLNIERDLY